MHNIILENYNWIILFPTFFICVLLSLFVDNESEAYKALAAIVNLAFKMQVLIWVIPIIKYVWQSPL
jgi:hypothetical protein